MFATLGFLYYTTLGFLVVVLIGVILGILAPKKKKFTAVKPTGTVSKTYKTVEGVHPTFQKQSYEKYNFQQEFQLHPPFQTHKIEEYKEITCPICDYYKGIKEKPKPLSAVEEMCREEDARFLKEINRGIHMQTSSGHTIELVDKPEYPKCETGHSGTKRWYNKEHQFHREDGPAIEYRDGVKCWYLNDQHYTEEDWKKELDKPKCETDKNGNKHWTNKDGAWHREDGPAYIYTNGTKIWWINGLRHREDGPAAEYADGRRGWYLNGIKYTEEQWKKELDKPTCITETTKHYRNKEGRYHREDGPAYEDAFGTKHWCINGYFHRTDGPAIIRPGTEKWYLDGVEYTEEEWLKELEKPICKTDSVGNKIWRNKEGHFHREDGPAVVYPNGNGSFYLNNVFLTEEEWKKELDKPKCTTDSNGTKIWKNKQGQAHREDGPAFEYTGGSKFWYINGQRHREDGPTVEYPDGSKRWYLHNKEYSEEEWKKELDKPVCKIDGNGEKRWYNKEGKYHREDGPAYETPQGYKQWIVNGKFHREDGPALENNQGLKQWWLNGLQYYTEEEWKQAVWTYQTNKQIWS